MTEERESPAIHVAPAPHFGGGDSTTRRMMTDVLISLVPLAVAALWVFKLYALKQLVICGVSCVAAEVIFTAMRRRKVSIGDGSAWITGLILAMSLPGTAPWYVGVIGSFAAIGLGKIVFGGLGQNIFNPAMVGRAFVMIAFTQAMAAPAYQNIHSSVQAITEATPLTAHQQDHVVTGLWNLFLGNTNGCLGETSALACLIGGAYLLIRRTAAWQIPLGAILAVVIIGGIQNLANPSEGWNVLHQLFGGALLFGAFFIATDPVSSPLTPWGRLIFGLGFGACVMFIRSLSAYPEGVMFSVLLMNALTPLINRWTVPRPLGGPVPQKA